MQDTLILLHSKLPAASRDTIYVVGGFLRDSILEYRPDDLDLVVEGPARPAALLVASVLSGSLVELDPSRSIYRVALNGHHIDLEGTGPGGLQANLKKRDFTINALALPLADSRKPDWQNYILDPFDGREDMRSRTLRAVSGTALADDPLRGLRAFRIAGKLGFAIEPQTLSLIRESARLIGRSAGERVWEELARILSLENAGCLLRCMDLQTPLLENILPEIVPLKALPRGGHHQEDAWNHSLSTVECLESIRLDGNWARPCQEYLGSKAGGTRTRLMVLKLGALLHDIGKPGCQELKDDGGFSFHGHDTKGEPIAAGIARRLKMSTGESDLLRLLVKEHMAPLTLFLSGPTPRALRRLFLRLHQDTAGVLLLSLADYMATRKGNHQAIAAYQDFISEVLSTFVTRGKEFTKKTALLNGYEIAKVLNIAPSPFIGQAIGALAEAEFDGLVTSKEEAVVFLLHWFANLGDEL